MADLAVAGDVEVTADEPKRDNHIETNGNVANTKQQQQLLEEQQDSVEKYGGDTVINVDKTVRMIRSQRMHLHLHLSKMWTRLNKKSRNRKQKLISSNNNSNNNSSSNNHC